MQRPWTVALLALLVGALARPSAAQEPPERSWFASFHINDWRAGAARREGIPFRIDNPYLRSHPLGAELGRQVRGPRWEGRYALVHTFGTSVGFDDGAGRNRTLNQDGGRRSLTELEGTLRRRFGGQRWIFGLGPGAAFDYERLTLDFRDVGSKRTWMAGLEVGVSTALEWRFLDRMRARMEVDNLVRLPWVTYGRLSSPLRDTASWSSGLHSRISLSASRAFRNGLSAELIFRRDERLESDEVRGHFMDERTPGTGGLVTRDDCWIVRFGIRH